MSHRRYHLIPCLLTLLLCLAMPGGSRAADAVARSDQPQTLTGTGDRELIIEGPFSLAWQSAGGRFAVSATQVGSDKPSAASSTQGKGQGRIKLRGAERYRVAIAAEGDWTLTLSW